MLRFTHGPPASRHNTPSALGLAGSATATGDGQLRPARCAQSRPAARTAEPAKFSGADEPRETAQALVARRCRACGRCGLRRRGLAATSKGFDHGISGEKLAEAAGLSVPRVYQIRDGQR